MKKLIALFTVIALTTGIVGFAQKQPKKNNKRETIEFFVTSEKLCHNCERKINNNIPFEKGVTGLNVDLENNTVKITYRKDRTSPEKLKAAFAKLKMEVKEVNKEQKPEENTQKEK